MFIPIILRSNKTIVSVATGHTKFWPLYISIGNIQNRAWRAHGNAVILIAFLSIPKSECYFLTLVSLSLIWLNSRQEARWKRGVSKFLAADVSHIPCQNSLFPQIGYNKAWSTLVSGWPFSMCYIWCWPLHCRLPRASSSCVCCPEVVPKVWSALYMCVYVWQVWKIKVYSSLSTTRFWWATSQEDQLIYWHIYEEIPNSETLDTIWNNWESSGSCLHFIYNTTLSDFPTSVAIYSVLSSCRHIRAYHPRSTSPSD